MILSRFKALNQASSFQLSDANQVFRIDQRTQGLQKRWLHLKILEITLLPNVRVMIKFLLQLNTGLIENKIGCPWFFCVAHTL